MTTCNDVVEHQRLGGPLIQVTDRVSQPRRPHLESSSLWIPQVSPPSSAVCNWIVS